MQPCDEVPLVRYANASFDSGAGGTEAGKSVLGKVMAVVTSRAIAQGEQVVGSAAGPSGTVV